VFIPCSTRSGLALKDANYFTSKSHAEVREGSTTSNPGYVKQWAYWFVLVDAVIVCTFITEVQERRSRRACRLGLFLCLCKTRPQNFARGSLKIPQLYLAVALVLQQMPAAFWVTSRFPSATKSHSGWVTEPIKRPNLLR
jgi:hypothetical protein